MARPNTGSCGGRPTVSLNLLHQGVRKPINNQSTLIHPHLSIGSNGVELTAAVNSCDERKSDDLNATLKCAKEKLRLYNNNAQLLSFLRNKNSSGR